MPRRAPEHPDVADPTRPGPHPNGAGGAMLVVRPWWEAELAVKGHDPLDAYAETHWLPVVGPSSLCALRFITRRLNESPRGFRIPQSEFARSIGLGRRTAPTAPSVRCLERLCYFDLMRPVEPARLTTDDRDTTVGPVDPPHPARTYEARTHLPALPAHLIGRLPTHLRGSPHRR